MKIGTLKVARIVACSSRIALGTALLSGGLMVAPAQAQVAAPVAAADADADPREILVTARRKSEDILKTPISISALTSEDIGARGITTIQDIAQAVPGLNVQQTATQGGRADRSFTSIQLRGFTPSTSTAQTTSIFIDGAPVSSATALQTLTNPERVEVIKGPQSALFGRQTFAGALNVVTKAPSDHLTGSFVGSAGTRANYDAQGEISAPLIDDVLSFRLSARAEGKHGSYKNAFVPGQTLGDQTTKTGSLAIQFKPTSNLTFKAFGLVTELKDGPNATGLIASKGSTVNGQTLVAGQSNCNITTNLGVTNPFFCGVAPGLSSVAPSSNTALTQTVINFLSQTTGRVLSPEDGVKGYGLVNHYRHYHFNADWALGDSGVTLSSLTAFNSEKKSELADLDNYYSVSAVSAVYPEGYYNFPFLVEGKSHDFSQELRASFENGGPLHASAGGSYLNQRNQTSSGSPFTFSSTIGRSTFSGAQQSRTYGLFASLGYDFSDHFTLSADARYQIDKIYAYAGQGGINMTSTVPGVVKVAEGALITDATFKNFMPRVIAQYNFDRSNMVYASFSKGVNPGAFNTNFITSIEPVVRNSAATYGFSVEVEPEKITNYEIGAKGRLFGVVRYDMAAYLAIWDNQIQNQSLNIPADGLGQAAAGAPVQLTASVNSGRVRVSGLEGNVGITAARGLDIDASAAYVDTYILAANNIPIASFYNIPAGGFRGKENPFVSKYSANVGVSYSTPIKDDVDAFGRADFTYKSGGWADIANVVRAPDLTQVNLRLGVRNKTFSIEGYVTNLFNNKAYYNVGSGSQLVNGVTVGAYGALLAQLRDLRTMGLRGSVNF